ncbi:MAG: branched-chain amino acid ABC transporter permease [Proteobacteria bacterium]|nr:branched-chain amino acid ABC transporter permease [Pseudomonadota bacterium]
MRLLLEIRKELLFSLAIYLLLKVFFINDIFSEYIEQVILYTIIIVVASLGLNIIYGFTGQFSLGHAGFYGLGAYFSAYLTKTFSIESGLLFIFIILLSGAFSAFIAYLIGIPILKFRDDFLAIATLGLGILIRNILDNSDRFIETLGGSRGFVGINSLSGLEIVFFVSLFFILISKNIIYSKYGLFWRTIRDDETASSSIGINTTNIKLLAFVYGCFLAGSAGAMYAHLYTFLHPSNFDFLKSVDFLVIVIVGGMGSISGTIIAGFLWVFIIEGLRILLPPDILELRWVIIPVILIIIMMWKPYGLMIKKKVI